MTSQLITTLPPVVAEHIIFTQPSPY